jgi:hypothetical protein
MNYHPKCECHDCTQARAYYHNPFWSTLRAIHPPPAATNDSLTTQEYVEKRRKEAQSCPTTK